MASTVVSASRCTASISGAGSVVTEAIFAFVLAGLCAVSAFVVYAFGLEMFKRPEEQPFMKKMIEKYGGFADVFRGLLIVTSAPFIAFYFVLSAMNQGVRKISFISITKRLDETDRDLRLTKIGAALFEILRQWKWTKVLVYGIYWGIFFFTCNVVISKFTVLFLSWLIVQLESLSLGLISLIFFITGFAMFMLPPVPGIPVYLSSGKW